MPLKKQCSHCKAESTRLTRGYCAVCYARYLRNGTAEYVRPVGNLGVRQCSHCESVEGPFIKTLCRACYHRQHRTGSVERTRVRHLCEAKGCDEPVMGNRLCQKHYMRVRRHGDAEAGRPEGWGAKSAHPMWENWKSLLRSARSSGGHDPRWTDFWAFLEDVGERPTPKHRIKRKNRSAPYTKENVEWQAPIWGESQRIDKATYMRAYYAKRPDMMRDGYLRRRFGISLADYQRMLDGQDGKCAVCKKPETMIDGKTGRPFPLAVDHCHAAEDEGKMKIRGLLCVKCNMGLGAFGDVIDLFHAAIAYLEYHAGLNQPDASPVTAPARDAEITA